MVTYEAIWRLLFMLFQEDRRDKAAAAAAEEASTGRDTKSAERSEGGTFEDVVDGDVRSWGTDIVDGSRDTTSTGAAYDICDAEV